MKRIISFAAILILILNMAACSTNVNAVAKTNGKTEGVTNDSSSKPTLSVYYMLNTRYVYNAICEFKSLYSNVNIEQKLYTLNSLDDFNKSLTTEILSGGGPDVFICKPLRDVDSINRIFSNSAFVDLNELISKDDDFKLDNFDKNIFDIGVINGRREFVPLYYSTPLIFTTETVLKENGISINEDCTIKELDNVVDSFLKNNSHKSKYLVDCNFNFFYLLNFYGQSFIDYKNKKCDFDTSEFKDLLRLYKRMQPVIAPENEFDGKNACSELDYVKNNIVAMMTDTQGTIWNSFANNCFARHYYNEDLKVVKISGSNGKIRPITTDVAAINSNCRNKKLAYDFLKVLLSDEIQRMLYSKDNSNSPFNPVNNNTYYKELDKYSQPAENMGMGAFGLIEPGNKYVEVKLVTMPEALVSRIKGIKKDITQPIFLDNAIKTIILDTVKEYISGKNDEGKTAKLINDKIQLFLNE